MSRGLPRFWRDLSCNLQRVDDVADNSNQRRAWVSYQTLGAEQGATAVEYALLIALVAAVIFAAVAGLGGQLPGLYDRVCPAFGC